MSNEDTTNALTLVCLVSTYTKLCNCCTCCFENLMIVIFQQLHVKAGMKQMPMARLPLCRSATRNRREHRRQFAQIQPPIWQQAQRLVAKDN